MYERTNMRNLLQYPITDEEVLNFLDHLSEEYDYKKTLLVGDMRPTIIEYIKEIVKMPRIIRVIDGESKNEEVSKS